MIRQIGRLTLAAALAIAATVGLAAESWADCELPDGRYHFDSPRAIRNASATSSAAAESLPERTSGWGIARR